jgi:hypothetical protein
MRSRSLLATVSLALLLAGPATASTLIDRNARNVKLTVDSRGTALVSYRDQHGRDRRVLASGAVDAELAFKLDYSGGRGRWKGITTCGPYDGPRLAWLVTACKAPDGSYWALQRWQRLLPRQGGKPSAGQAAWELRLSHWRGDIPLLEIHLDWIYGGKYRHLFGRYTYSGKPIFGFKSTSTGVPLDAYGRNIYLDVLDAPYGSGWRREGALLTHRPHGNFCWGFYPRKSLAGRSRGPAGEGRRYRATAVGPGVAPDASWSGPALGAFDPEHERAMNALGDQFAAGDPLCRQH